MDSYSFRPLLSAQTRQAGRTLGNIASGHDITFQHMHIQRMPAGRCRITVDELYPPWGRGSPRLSDPRSRGDRCGRGRPVNTEPAVSTVSSGCSVCHSVMVRNGSNQRKRHSHRRGLTLGPGSPCPVSPTGPEGPEGPRSPWKWRPRKGKTLLRLLRLGCVRICNPMG